MMSLYDLYSQHYRPARLITAAAHTKKRFEFDIARLESMLGRKATIADLNTNTISTMLEGMIESGLALATVSGTRKKMRALWQFAYLRRIVDVAPELPDITEEVDPPSAWTEDEVRRLLKACRKTKGELCGVPADLFWHSLVCTILDCATRIGATLAVEWLDINFDRSTILFRATHAKTKRGQLHSLRPETAAELQDIREIVRKIEPDRKLVWKLPFQYCQIGYHFKAILESAGLPATHRDMFHKLRRSVASWFFKAGGDASHLLGHTSIKHLRRYLDESQLDRPTPARLLPCLNQPIASRQQAKTELERLLERFLADEKTKDRQGGTVSPAAIAGIRNGVTRFTRIGKLQTLADLSPEMVARAAKQVAENSAANSFKIYCKYLKRFLRWLASEGHDMAAAIEVIEAGWKGGEAA